VSKGEKDAAANAGISLLDRTLAIIAEALCIRNIDLDARCGELSTGLLRDGWQQNPF